MVYMASNNFCYLLAYLMQPLPFFYYLGAQGRGASWVQGTYKHTLVESGVLIGKGALTERRALN